MRLCLAQMKSTLSEFSSFCRKEGRNNLGFKADGVAMQGGDGGW